MAKAVYTSGQIVNKINKSGYMSLVYIPSKIPYELPDNYEVAEDSI